MTRLGPALLLALLASACGPDPRDCTGEGPFSALGLPRGPVAETLLVSGRHLVLESSLFRDFMPISPPGGKPMFAVVGLIEVDSLAIPPGVRHDHLWVVQGQRIWSATLVDRGMPYPPDQLWSEARCGPKWPPGTETEIVVRVRTPAGDRFLRQRHVVIQRVD